MEAVKVARDSIDSEAATNNNLKKSNGHEQSLRVAILQLKAQLGTRKLWQADLPGHIECLNPIYLSGYRE